MNKNSSFFIALLAVSLSGILIAQDVHGTDSLSNKGKKAFTFSFNGLNLSGGLGGTYWIANDYAIRILGRGNYRYNKNLTENTGSISSSIGASACLKKCFPISRTLSPYVGSGIAVDLDYYTTSSYSEASKSGRFTVPVLAGAEYWFTEQISLSAEQTIGFTLYLSQSSREYTLSSSTSTLLLSVYF